MLIKLFVEAGSVRVSGSNQSFGTPEARGAEALRDMAGRYVKMTGVNFAGGKFDGSGICTVKGEAGEATR